MNSVKHCTLCSAILPNLTYFLKHIRQAHSHRPGFKIVWGLGGCPRTFESFGNYRNHVYGFHEPITIQATTPQEGKII